MSGRLLTGRDVADLFGVSVETVQRWTRAGKLPGIRLCGTARGRLRYREEDIALLLEAWDTGAATEKRQLPDAAPALSLPVPTVRAAPTEKET